MSPRPSERAEVRRSLYKVAVDVEEGRRRREDNMVEIRKSHHEESLLKKRRDGISPSAAAASCSSSSGSWCCIWGSYRQADSTVDLHQRVALCQQCPAPGEHHRLCAQRRCVYAVLPAVGLQHDLHMRHRRVRDVHRDQGHGGRSARPAPLLRRPPRLQPVPQLQGQAGQCRQI